MPHLICYDIEDNYRRTKIGEHLIAAGFDRIQYSVYLGSVAEPVLTQVTAFLSQKMEKSIDKDSLLIIQISDTQVKEMLQIGKKALDVAEIMGEKHTLLFSDVEKD